MSGSIEDLPIRVCPSCGASYMEDQNMYEDVDRCPNCGRQVDTSIKGTDRDVDI